MIIKKVFVQLNSFPSIEPNLDCVPVFETPKNWHSGVSNPVSQSYR